MSGDLSIDDDSVTDCLLDLNLRIPKNPFFPKTIEDFEEQKVLKDPLHYQQQEQSESHKLTVVQQPNQKHLIDPVMKLDDFITTG
jgi:hypothetical protein